jgi:hypothetical protein
MVGDTEEVGLFPIVSTTAIEIVSGVLTLLMVTSPK